MKPSRFVIQVLAVSSLGFMTAAAPARAGLIGSTVVSQYYTFGGTYGSSTMFTAEGAAHSVYSPQFTVTVTNDQIIYQFNSSGSWSSSPTSLNSGGLFITSGNLLSFAAPPITAVKINSATNMTGFTLSNLTFNTGAIAVSWAGLGFNSSTKVVLDVTSVDEPPASALLVLGVGAVTFSRRPRWRRKLG
ncbi:hypothetical protein [Paludisphaera rhizosphaerae]|uniref:hypothetical protein n=1 Tax=Paludisphaera rhizosphaerae TaxID=2711216 RepID=UPI0013EDD033|nr:hypothetical protein [Paludisphaera rhizosphaerae]